MSRDILVQLCIMAMRLLGPDQPLSDEIIAALASSNDSIFAVAYISSFVQTELLRVLDAVTARAGRRSFRIRILFRSRDLQTDPDAIQSLLDLRDNAAGTVEVKHDDGNFHAKAFAFKRSRRARPEVIIGSANLTNKALACESGELGVWIGSSKSADDAWFVLEAMLDNGKPVTPKWLSKYRKLYMKRQEIERRARKIRMRPTRRTRRRMPLDLRKTAFYVFCSEDLDSATAKSLERALKADEESSHRQLPDRPQYWRFDTKAAAISFADQHHSYVLNLHFENSTGGRERLCSLELVKPKDAIRLFDDDEQRAHWVVWYERYRGYRVWLPRWGRSRTVLPRVLGRMNVNQAWLERQNNRLPRAKGRQKLAEVFLGIRAAQRRGWRLRSIRKR